MKYSIIVGRSFQSKKERKKIMNDLRIFDNEEFGEIRTISINGEPWFVGKDVAAALGYGKPTDTIRKRVDEEDRSISKMETPQGMQDMAIINESGLYSLIFSSKLESAKRFKHWVTSEVLPSIRKTGAYVSDQIAPAQIPIGEVASYIKAMDRVFVRQQLAPHKIAEAFVMLSEQFGIHLPEGCVKVPEYEQMELSFNRGG